MPHSDAAALTAGLPNPDEPDYVIAASASQIETTPRTLKHDDTFAVFDAHGDAVPGLASNHGIFHRDTRHLSHFFLTMEGVRPLLLSSTVRDDNATLSCDLTNPDLPARCGEPELLHDLIHLRRSRFLYRSACHECLSVHNFDVVPRRFEIALSFSADFADLFEVRGARRTRRGTIARPLIERDGVRLVYTGLDRRTRQTALRFEPAPTELSGDTALFRIALEPGETQVIYVEIRCDGAPAAPSARLAFRSALKNARADLRARAARAASVISSNHHFNEGLRRAVSDLNILITDTPEGAYPYAGVPWFSTVFGRDALITAFEMLWMDPAIARGVLLHLAANQAQTSDPAADAEPGKILHEVRFGEMAELGEVPFRRYYGSVDSTPLFVMLAGAHLKRTGDVTTARLLWPAVESALRWITDHGDRDGDGFVEYGRRSGDGLINQGWKDSHDSVFHADGRLARGPIALVEVQGYVYAAWRAAADLARSLGHASDADLFAARAQALRSAFDTAFFDPALGTYVLALDGEKRPCRVRSSNAGHALFSGIALTERAEAVVSTLMANASFSGWGVRTLAAGEARFNPMSYHNGSVWPHDNAMIAMGFARYGFGTEVARIFEGLFRASVYFDLRRLPELFCGFARARSQGPVSYPVACAPQAWAAAAPLALLQASLGLDFDVAQGQVTFERPVLPRFLDELILRGLTVADGALDVKIQRVGASAALSVIGRKGHVGLKVVA
ncbi:amylo-alpha-1,6-glucosidase [Xanthobacter dioxanivorans]|uniref:Amylo-alpha-1,6-glucosidase n=1 Tax=Xanthobacter dioxanivorans TaxID=2528964 RepID=A0A974SIB8_9HYPH|nr:amylo-alpha-1,6-glucosidase [Xanthobacter dioxanivorans]QRG06535.1 amylo-alpha-1,6-glucosidase [Xanthobacter dioxanivorans]